MRGLLLQVGIYPLQVAIRVASCNNTLHTGQYTIHNSQVKTYYMQTHTNCIHNMHPQHDPLAHPHNMHARHIHIQKVENNKYGSIATKNNTYMIRYIQFLCLLVRVCIICRVQKKWDVCICKKHSYSTSKRERMRSLFIKGATLLMSSFFRDSRRASSRLWLAGSPAARSSSIASCCSSSSSCTGSSSPRSAKNSSANVLLMMVGNGN